jgi:hypothetical protein
MALVFPSNPSVNDTYQVNGRTYVWNGTSWRTVKGGVPDVVPTLSVDNDFSAGGTLHIDSTNNEIGIGTAAPSHQLHLTQDLGVDGALVAYDTLSVGASASITGDLTVGGTITVPTPVAGTNDTKVATTAFVGDAVSTAVSGLLDGAPAALDTLNELAAALDDDASYASTITTALAGKIGTTATFGGDVSGTYDNIVISDDSHNHIIGNVDGLQTALDAKQAASTALTTSTSFAGDVSGTYNAIVVADDSHNHIISNVDGLQTELDGKLSLTGGTVTGGIVASGGISGLDINNGISGSNFDITGVNQITINDPGEGLVWGGGASGSIWLVVVDDASDNILRTNATAFQVGTSTVWHAGNDGSGSGLDADTLDGSHASAFAASSHTHSYAATSHTHSYLPTSGGTLSGNLVFSGDSYIQFEGSTADGYETFLRATNPTADRTIYLPNAGGTLSLDGHTHSYISTSTTQSSQLYIRNTSPTVYFRDTDHRSAMIHVNSSIFYVLRGSGNDSTTWETYNGHWPLTLNLNNNDATFGGDIYMRSVNNNRPTINRVGGIYFTWDSDSYGTNDQHSIRSTNGDTWGDHITINSYGNVRINIDSNGNGNNTFSIGRHTTGTANELLTVDESGNIGVAGYVESAGQIRSVGVYNAATPATNDLIHCATSAFFRSTSVRASKKDIEPLDDAHADLLLQAQPVWYRSAMPQDDDRLSYYGFIAEDMAELDPRFANWGVSNDCQCTEEQLATYEHTFDHPPECVVPTGIPYERLTAHLTNLVQRQHARIESLESRIEALEAN